MCVGAGSAGLGVCDQVCILYYIVLYCTMIGMMNIVVHLLYMCIQVPCLFILYDVLCVLTQIVRGLIESGLTREQALSHFTVCTVQGALGSTTNSIKETSHINDITRAWVNEAVPDGSSLLETMATFKPHVLLGLSASPNIFTEDLIRMMASNTERPIIMPMSNPTSRCECTPEQAYTYTHGRAIVSTGTGFPPVELPSGVTLIPSQCNARL